MNKFYSIKPLLEKDIGTLSVLEKYLGKHCDAVTQKNVIYVQDYKVIKLFTSQQRFISFCVHVASPVKLKIKKSELPELDKIYRTIENAEKVFDVKATPTMVGKVPKNARVWSVGKNGKIKILLKKGGVSTK